MHSKGTNQMINRRHFLVSSSAIVMCAVTPIKCFAAFEISHSEKVWRKLLTPAQFAILRKWKTERAFTNSLYGEKSNLLRESRAGTYNCAACNLPLYSSEKKYDSGTGWPSFSAPIDGNVDYRDDRYFLKILVEVHCKRCGGHLGHVFDDGPQPTGKRHCINGLALTFEEN